MRSHQAVAGLPANMIAITKETDRKLDGEDAASIDEEAAADPPFLAGRSLRSGASPALAWSFHRALRLTRCVHRHDLPDLVASCGRIGLRVQRELLRVQWLGGALRLHDGSKWLGAEK